MTAPREPVPGVVNLRVKALDMAVSTKSLSASTPSGEVDSRPVLTIAREYLAFLRGGKANGE